MPISPEKIVKFYLTRSVVLDKTEPDIAGTASRGVGQRKLLIMNRIVASVGLVALGASALSSASGQQVSSPDNSKPWSIAATLRGFYDDNTGTISKDTPVPPGDKRSSFGFEFAPSGMWSWSPQEQTSFNLGALYSVKYYLDKPPFSADHTDQAFTFSAGANHAFSEQLKARVNDSFVIGQEPDMLQAGNSYATFTRIPGDNIRNYGSIALDWQAAPKFGLSFGYDNAYYDYAHNTVGTVPAGFNDAFGSPVYNIVPSLAATLNRIENRAHVEGLYQVLPETKALIGYQFTDFSYTGDQLIGGYYDPLFGLVYSPVYSQDRNMRQHTVYAGVIHNFLPELTGSIRAGASYVDFYNDPSTSPYYTPYALMSLKYAYAKESSLEVGFSYDQSASDVVGFSNGTFTQSSEAAVAFANVMHRITPQLFASLIFQFQNTMYHGGTFDNVADQYYMLGLDLEYRFTANFSAHTGYNYDELVSEIHGRGYDRNRVYIGVTASY